MKIPLPDAEENLVRCRLSSKTRHDGAPRDTCLCNRRIKRWTKTPSNYHKSKAKHAACQEKKTSRGNPSVSGGEGQSGETGEIGERGLLAKARPRRAKTTGNRVEKMLGVLPSLRGKTFRP